MPAFAWDKNQQIAASGFQRMTAYEKLMKAGLEFRRSDLRVNLPAGNIKGDVTLRLLKDMTFMQFAPPIARPGLILDIFYLKSNFSLPVKPMGANPRMLAPVYPGMQTGLFVRNRDNRVHQAEARNSKLMVNGRKVVLSLEIGIQTPPASFNNTAWRP
jgi:hypothetical protein